MISSSVAVEKPLHVLAFSTFHVEKEKDELVERLRVIVEASFQSISTPTIMVVNGLLLGDSFERILGKQTILSEDHTGGNKFTYELSMKVLTPGLRAVVWVDSRSGMNDLNKDSVKAAVSQIASLQLPIITFRAGDFEGSGFPEELRKSSCKIYPVRNISEEKKPTFVTLIRKIIEVVGGKESTETLEELEETAIKMEYIAETLHAVEQANEEKKRNIRNQELINAMLATSSDEE